MANIGLKYMVYAPITEVASPASVAWAAGKVLSRAIQADLSIELNEAQLYADDRMVESIKEFKNGTLTLNGDDLANDVRAELLGHTVTTEPSGEQIVTARGDDDGAYVGVGFYAVAIKDGVRKFRAIWVHKVKFAVPNETLQTKGDSIAFQTPTIEGTVLTDILGVWKEEGYFVTEAEAIAWLDGKAVITPVVPPLRERPPAENLENEPAESMETSPDENLESEM